MDQYSGVGGEGGVIRLTLHGQGRLTLTTLSSIRTGYSYKRRPVNLPVSIDQYVEMSVGEMGFRSMVKVIFFSSLFPSCHGYNLGEVYM